MTSERSIRYLLSTFDLGGNPGSSLAAWRWQQRVEQRIKAVHLDLAAEVPIVAAIDWVAYTPAHTFSDWAEEVRLHLERGAAKSDLQVFLGGNHLGVMPLYLWWLGRHKGTVAVLDAHHDFNPTQDWSELSHSNFLYLLAQDHDLAAAGMRWFGCRDDAASLPEWVRQRTFESALWCAKIELPSVAISASGEGLFLDIDVDVLEPAAMPACVSRTPGGLRVDEARLLIGNLITANPVELISVTEYNPLLDDPLGGGFETADRLLVTALRAWAKVQR